jgi:replicative DNA helicase
MQNGDGKAKKPGQADLRGSAQVNYDADLILLLEGNLRRFDTREALSIKTSRHGQYAKPCGSRKVENLRTRANLFIL